MNKQSAAVSNVKPFVLRMPVELHRMLRTFAASRGRSMNEVLVEVLEEWWRRNPDRRAFERLP
ncbi:MAG: Arc family DNA-binding protein [Deltaproteobacteria bacterium]|nr:Arc family DNA-binding protein [Deltaproteobacteria bacterium]